MEMSILVRDVSKVIIKPAMRGESRHILRLRFFRFGTALGRTTLQSPFANRRRRVTRAAHDCPQRVVILQRLIELIVAHIRVPLMDAQEQRSPRRRADRRGAVVMPQLHPFRRELVDIRRRMPRLRTISFLASKILEKNAVIPVTEIVRQNKNDIRPLGRGDGDAFNENHAKEKRAEKIPHIGLGLF
jgi:hypothetical protein